VRVAALTVAEVLDELLVALPEFRPTFDEHLADYGVLPHVLFGDLTRFVLAAHERGDTNVEERSLAFLDRALLEGDKDVQNLVAGSFVENVPPWDPTQRAFIAAWPDTLRAEAERQRDWRPSST
jgi:hypothetical protein